MQEKIFFKEECEIEVCAKGAIAVAMAACSRLVVLPSRDTKVSDQANNNRLLLAYQENSYLIENGLLVAMVADHLGRNLKKFRAGLQSKLDKNYKFLIKSYASHSPTVRHYNIFRG